MNIRENTTVANNSNATFKRTFETDVAKYTFLCLVAIVLLYSIFTTAAIIKTKRIPFAAKLLISLTLICNSSFLVVCISGYILKFLLFEEIPEAIVTELVRICSVVSWSAVTILSLEHVVCLYCPYLYTTTANEQNITKLVVASVGLVLSAKLSLRYLIIPALQQEEFDFVNATSKGHFNMYFLAVCIFINTVCYILIFLVVKNQIRAIKALYTTEHRCMFRRHFVSTRNIACIIAVFQSAHVPLLISILVRAFQDDDAKNEYLSAISMLIMCAVNPVLYAWRLKECRFVMLRFLCKFCKGCDSRVETMRLEVYSISTSVRLN